MLRLPIAHGEGRYQCDELTLKKLQDQDQIALRYINNPNGSVDNIAGLTNSKGNVLGMMPHPERCCEDEIGGTDGSIIFNSIYEKLDKLKLM